MSNVDHAYEDRWGSCIDRPDEDYLEIRWYDSTSAMQARDFNEWLAGFATLLEQRRRGGVLVDSVAFRMDGSQLDMEWRDANVIPRYNAAGLGKMAFHVGAGFPAAGAPPAPEGPADFPTGYFLAREAALEWLAS